MAGRYPNPDGEKVNRHAPSFAWVDLPRGGRSGKPPSLPVWMRKWQPATRKWWATTWQKPQAVMWEQDGSTMWTLACLQDDLLADRTDAAKVSAEMRQHEDRHGLNPKAMLQLRWRLEPEENDMAAADAPGTGSSPSGRRDRLRVV